MQFPYRYRTAIVVLGLLLNSFSSAVATDNKAGENEPKAVVLKDATIHSMGPEGTFEGTIVVVDGKIKSIGPDVKTPDLATVYDLKGFHVTPGLIESRGKLWITPQAASEINTKAELNVVDAIDPWNEDWRELAAQGITSVYVQQNSLSAVGGFGAVLRVGPHGSVDKIVMKDEVAVQVSIGTRGRTSKDRLAQVKALEKLLKAAKDQKEKDEKKKDSAKKDKDDKSKKDDDKKDEKEDDEKKEDAKDSEKKETADKEKETKKDDKPEKKDVTKEVFKRVINREIPLYIEVHHSDSLKRIVALAKEYKIRVVLDGLSNVGSCADELEDGTIPVVVGPFFESGVAPVYRKDLNLDWFSETNTNEQLWSLSSFGATARSAQSLRINASKAIGLGIDADATLQAVTVNAARMLGVVDHVGTLEEGKQADIAVFAGHPMDSSTPARLVMSHGTVTFENEVTPVASEETTDAVALPNLLPESYAVKTTRMLKDGKFGPGMIVVKDGKIMSVGTKVTLKDTQLYDLGDTIVTPGLVIAHTSLGQAATINDPTESDASHLRAADAFDPTTKQAHETLADGFVHLGLAPSASNTSSGAMGQIRLGVGDYVVNPMVANQFNLSNSARNPERFPASLNGQVRMISDLFSGQLTESRVYLSPAVAESVAMEKLNSMRDVSEGKRKSIFLAMEKVEVRAALSLAKKHKLSPALASTGRIGDMAKSLAEQNFSLLVLPIGISEYGTRAQQTKSAVEAGLPIAFVGDTSNQVRTTASMLVAAGVPAQAVLKGMSEGGAGIVGMTKVGLARGANADFVVWSDSPLNLAAKPLNVVVDGKPVPQK